MSRIPDDVIDEIRGRVDIVAIVGEHVPLKKAGAEFRGLCPFHREKTPSFYVSPGKKFFHCFGCQKTGDVFRFLMELEGKAFAEAVRELAARVGVVVPEREETPEQRARRDERGRLLELNAVAATFYRALLAGDRGGRGRAYLESRGIGPEVAETFRLGLAPDAWDALARHLEARRLSPALAVTAGLLAPRRQGQGHYDRFRDRLMCPVILPAGEVVAFSGRRLGDDPEAPKYYNSPASPVYAKGQVLFGEHAARAAARRKGRAVIVEGNFDVISLHQAGFAETMAPLGTALTGRQVETLRLLGVPVILCLDGDEAGRRAALHHVVPLLEAEVETRVAVLPPGEDPDSFVRGAGADGLEELLGRATPAAEYFIWSVWGESDQGSSDRRAAALAEAAQVLARVPDETRRDMLAGELAAALLVEPEVVRRAVARTGGRPAAPRDRAPAAAGSSRPAAGTPITPPPPAELKVLAILAEHPHLFPLADREDVGSLLTDGRLRDMYSAARAGRPLVDVLPPGLGDGVLREVLSGSYQSLPDPVRTLEGALRSLRRERLLEEVESLDRRIKEAERRGDRPLVRELALRQLETRRRADALVRRPEEPR